MDSRSGEDLHGYGCHEERKVTFTIHLLKDEVEFWWNGTLARFNSQTSTET